MGGHRLRRFILSLLLASVFLPGVFLASSNSSEESSTTPVTASFTHLGANTIRGSFDGECRSQGVRFPPHQPQSLDLTLEGAVLLKRQVWVNHTQSPFSAIPLGKTDSRERVVQYSHESIVLPAGTLKISWDAQGLGAIYPYNYVESNPKYPPFVVKFQSTNVESAGIQDVTGEPQEGFKPMAWRDFREPQGFEPPPSPSRNQELTLQEGSLEVQGDFMIYLREASWQPNDEAIQGLGSWIREERHESATLSETRSLHYTDAFLMLKNARLPLGPSGVTVSCLSRQGTVSGEASFDYAAGEVRKGKEARKFDQTQVVIRGTFEWNDQSAREAEENNPLGIRVRTDGEGQTPNYGPYAVEGQASGDVQVLGLEFDTLSKPIPLPIKPATAGFLTLLGASLWIGFKNLGHLVGFFYARVWGAERVLEHEGRRRLFELVHQTPGLDLTQLAEHMGYYPGTVAYHVRVMNRNDLVRIIPYKNSIRVVPKDPRFLSPNGSPPREVILGDPRMRFVWEQVGDQSVLSADLVRAVCQQFGLTRRGARLLVARAVNRGLLQRLEEGNKIRFQIATHSSS